MHFKFDIMKSLSYKEKRPYDWEKANLERVIDLLSEDFRECKKEEIIRISSKYGNYNLWNHEKIVDSLDYALNKKKINIRCIIGDNISVSEENKNTLLNLGIQQKITLYGMGSLILCNDYITFGDRLAFAEDRIHQFSYNNIKIKYFNEEDNFSKPIIKYLIYLFDGNIKLIGAKKILKEDDIFNLKEKE